MRIEDLILLDAAAGRVERLTRFPREPRSCVLPAPDVRHARGCRRLARRWYGWLDHAPADRPRTLRAPGNRRGTLLPVRRALAVALALPVFAAIYLSVALRRGPATRIALALGIGGLILVAAVAAPTGTVGVPTRDPGPTRRKRARTGRHHRTRAHLAPARRLRCSHGRLLGGGRRPGRTGVRGAAQLVRGWTPPGRGTPRHLAPCDALHRDGRHGGPRPGGTGPHRTAASRLPHPGRDDRPARRDGRPALRRRRRHLDRHLLRWACSGGGPCCAPSGSCLRVPGELLVATDGPEGRDPTVADNFLWEPSSSSPRTRATRWISPPGSWTRKVARSLLSEPLVFTTTTAPTVVRFRSVGRYRGRRLAASRSRSGSRCPWTGRRPPAAFSVDVNGKEVRGTVDFAENDTVLVFDPAATLPVRGDRHPAGRCRRACRRWDAAGSAARRALHRRREARARADPRADSEAGLGRERPTRRHAPLASPS